MSSIGPSGSTLSTPVCPFLPGMESPIASGMSPGIWLCLVDGEPQWENGGKEENEVEVFIPPAPSLWCQGHYELSACLDQICTGTLSLGPMNCFLPLALQTQRRYGSPPRGILLYSLSPLVSLFLPFLNGPLFKHSSLYTFECAIFLRLNSD